MCGIAGLIHRGKMSDIGSEMTSMLQSLRHRGPDSTGFALYGKPDDDKRVMRYKVAEQEELRDGSVTRQQMIERNETVAARLQEAGATVTDHEQVTAYAHRCWFAFNGDMKELIKQVENIDGVEVLSVGLALELVKDLGDAETVADNYHLHGFQGTHGIGHTRMATESDVDIRSAHPYWAYPYNDVAVVHNGQITNYWQMRREFERRGHRFMSQCDSELLAVYVASNMEQGASLAETLKSSIKDIDGVFTYLVATKNELGMAKDTMAAKPMVLYESDGLVALASEEVAIRAVVPHEIDTWDPYDEEVRVWQA